MTHNLAKIITTSLKGLVVFLLGFALGTAIDIVFFKLYVKWDPNEKNNAKLLTIFISQIYIIILILTQFKKLEGTFSFGLMSSQVFLLVHTTSYISNMVYNRDMELYVPLRDK